ncbi:MAG: hypothetical protein U1E76_02595 [Planctomycetota bacterium]
MLARKVPPVFRLEPGVKRGFPGFHITRFVITIESLTVTSAGGHTNIGTFFDICMEAPTGYQVLLLASGGQGPTVTPYGTLCLDLPPIAMFSFPMPEPGARCFHRYLDCNPSYIGALGYLQFLAIDWASGDFGISNQTSITVVDGPCH